MIRRWQAPNLSLCFVANEKGWRWWVRGLSSSFPFLINYKTRRQVGGFIVIFSYKRRWRAPDLSFFLCVLSITCIWWQWVKGSLLLVLFFPILAKDHDKPPICPCLLMFCSLIPKDNNKAMLIIILFALFFVHLEKTTMNRCSSSSSSFCFLYVHPQKTMTNMLVIVFFCFLFVHPEKTTMNWCLLSFFFVLFLCT